jgi:Fuc2NAc and GlcNAc transferase
MNTTLLIPTSFVASWLLTAAALRHATSWGVLDRPNARSSHTRITPRGGGIAIVAVTLVGVTALATLGIVPWNLGLALIVGGGMVALIGLLDDVRSISAAARAGIHTIAAIVAVWLLGGLPRLAYGTGDVAMGWVGGALAAVGIVWMTNLYNFMDGIDGLAASQAVTTAGAAGLLLWASGDAGMATVAWLVASAALGFLAWNWSPARIFMGDVGSGFLGFLFGTLALATENRGSLPLLCWALLLGVFLVDATATLLRRIAAGEAWYKPHREHCYQIASRLWGDHSMVTSVIININCVLMAIAYLSLEHRRFLPVAATISAAALLTVWALGVRLGPRLDPASPRRAMAVESED